ncbi:MAG: histidine phosphatase family protein [Mariprofundus sp.]
MLTLDLLRHGALQGGIKYRGHTDDPLTAQGRADMDAVWRQLAMEVDIIVTSPLSRCAEAANDWAAQAAIPCIIEPRVAEIFYGSWEGKTSDEIRSTFPGMLEQWRRDPTGMRPPNGESPEELRHRLEQWLSEVSNAYQGRHMLLVSHSGVLRMLISLAMQAAVVSTRHMHMPYACWSRIQCSPEGNILCFHNHSVTGGAGACRT